jgi:hypothetical protein
LWSTRLQAVEECICTPGDVYLKEAISEYQSMLRQLHGATDLRFHARDKMTTLLLRRYSESTAAASTRAREMRKQQAAANKQAQLLALSAAGGRNPTSSAAAPAQAGSSRFLTGSSRRGRLVSPTRGTLSSPTLTSPTSASEAVEEVWGLKVERGVLTVSVMRAINVPDRLFQRGTSKKLSKKKSVGAIVKLIFAGKEVASEVGQPVNDEARSEDHLLSFNFRGQAFTWTGELHELAADKFKVDICEKDDSGSDFGKDEPIVGSGEVDSVTIVFFGERAEMISVPIKEAPKIGEAAKDGVVAMGAAAAQGRCELQLEVRWVPDRPLRHLGKIRVGRTLVEVVPTPLPGGMPSATADATAREKQMRECAFPFAWLLCGIDRHGKGHAKGSMSGETQSPAAPEGAPTGVVDGVDDGVGEGTLDHEAVSTDYDAEPFVQQVADGNAFSVTFTESVLGMQLNLTPDGTGIEVSAFSSIEEGKLLPAERSGKVFIGDRVIAIDGRSTKGASRDEVLDLIINAPRPVTIHFQHDSQQDLELQYQRTMATQRLQHPAVSKAWVPPFRRVKLPTPTAKLARSEVDSLVPAPAPAPTEPEGRPIQMQMNDFFRIAGDGLNAAGRNTGDFFKDLGENTVKIGENTVKTIADLPSNTVKTITSLSPLDLSPLDTEPPQPTRTGAVKATEVPEKATAGDAEKDAAPAAAACSYFYGDPSGQVQGPFPTATFGLF